MISRDIMLKILGQMDDEALLKALSVNGIRIGGHMQQGSEDQLLSQMAMPKDEIKGWSNLKIKRQSDDRPTLADKNYVVPVNAMLPMPEAEITDTGYDPFAMPGGT